jgi:hypothetical protein
VLGELLANLPYDRGCSIEASGCGIPESEVVRLRNANPEAEAALRRAALERQRTAEMCAAYLSRQDALEDFAAENRIQDNPPEKLPGLHYPMQWREGIEARAVSTHKEFMKKNPNGVQEEKNYHGSSTSLSVVVANGTKVTLKKDEIGVMNDWRRQILNDWGYSEGIEQEGEYDEEDLRPQRPLPAAFEKAFAPVLRSPSLIGFMIWNGARPAKDEVERKQKEREEQERIWQERNKNFLALSEEAKKVYDAGSKPLNVASAQLMAHFTYLCLGSILKGNDALKPLAKFGLKWITKAPRRKPRYGQDLHEAVSKGKIVIEAVTGQGFGIDSLELKLQSKAVEDIEITVQRGTIFQHISWEHRQNLMVAVDYVIPLPSKSTVGKKMMAYCMNSTCACSSGNPMSLTEFYFDDSNALESQGTVWDHFEQCFAAED